ncbi:MAG: hypothetical protein ABUS79_22690, partial [Pseudomonadota bacterium]
AVDRRIKAAHFPEVNTVDGFGFDFDFDPARKRVRARYLALHDLAFIDKGINPLFADWARHAPGFISGNPGAKEALELFHHLYRRMAEDDWTP